MPAVAAATIAPWAYRNYLVFHKFIPVSTLSGSNFLFGNNELALEHPDMMGYLVDRNIPGFQERARGLNEAHRDLVALEMAQAWLSEHRELWGSLVWTKVKKFWSPRLHQPSRLARRAMLLTGDSCSPWHSRRSVVTSWSFCNNRNSGVIVHMLIFSALVAYLIIYVIPRYRFPIEPFFIVLATVTVDWLALFARRRRRAVSTPFLFPGTSVNLR